MHGHILFIFGWIINYVLLLSSNDMSLVNERRHIKQIRLHLENAFTFFHHYFMHYYCKFIFESLTTGNGFVCNCKRWETILIKWKFSIQVNANNKRSLIYSDGPRFLLWLCDSHKEHEPNDGLTIEMKNTTLSRISNANKWKRCRRFLTWNGITLSRFL